MVLKRAISSLLVFTFVIPATVASQAFAQSTPVSGSPSSILAFSDDPIQLILAAMKTSSPVEARALLDRAKLKIADEELPKQSQRTINELLARAASRLPAIPAASFQAKPPQSFTVAETGPQVPNTSLKPVGTVVAKDSAHADDITAVEAMIRDNPELRDSMREISRGRLMRDASVLPKIILDQTNQSIATHDEADSANEKALTDITGFAGAMIGAMKSVGAISDHAAVNKALREKFETVPVSTLANQIIFDSTKWSAGAGFLKAALIANGYSTSRVFAGVSVEAFMTMAINVNLIMQLSDLYNIKMGSSQQEIVILFALLVSKLSVRYGSGNPLIQQTAIKLGSLISNAAHSGAPGAMNALAKKAFETLPTSGSTGAAGQAVESGAKSGGTAGPGWKIRAGLMVKQALFSGGETLGIGIVTKLIVESAAETERQLSNESFRNYLMSSKGEGFIKLLVLAMNTGNKVPNIASIANTKDAKANFILNIARSTRVCSREDNMRFKSLISSGVDLFHTNDRDYKILKFTCDSNLSSGRYDRMAREFTTFDEIPQEIVATLRVASYENRLRMGEILMQLQFLDGDQDPKELHFFETTIGKILGFERLDDSKYFDRMHAFIREQGGMMSNPESPTGYTIGDKKVKSPYDLSIGYTAAGGPDSPRPAVVNVVPATNPVRPATAPITGTPVTPPAAPSAAASTATARPSSDNVRTN